MNPDVERDGFVVFADVVDDQAVSGLIEALSNVTVGDGVRRRESVYAVRNLLDAAPNVAALAESPAVRALVEPVLGVGCFAVRGILFDKTPDANWNVVWHQDLSIAVREKRDVPGFGPWSEKAGVIHVQPPASVLERMLTVRLHLDDCDASNGPLQVLPGTHRGGRLSADEIQQKRQSIPATICPVPAGGALLMRPLLLHSSSASQSPRHRRVIHLEYAADALPGGLSWDRQPPQ